jgi:glycosyltransferase involved in cell wall biosynthesis
VQPPKKILIDGFNLALERATGVATYARGLSRALGAMGYSVDVAYGLGRIGGNLDALLAEIEFFDPVVRATGRLGPLLDRLNHIATLTLAPTRGVMLQPIPIGGHVVTRGIEHRLPHFQHLYNSPHVYFLANIYFALTGRRLPLRAPERIDVAHWTYPLPIKLVGAKNVYTMHDLVPIKLPFATLDNKRFYLRLMRHLARRADRIVTVSENSKRDIQSLLGVKDEQVAVTYQSIDLPSWIMEETDESIGAMLNRLFRLELRSYLLYLGAIEPKKNVSRLIEGYLLSDAKVPLVIAGPMAWKTDDELRLLKTLEDSEGISPGKRIRLLGHVDGRHLLALLRGAACLVFPSLYEGFGLPVLEAMAAGTPVITSKTSSMPEVAGDAALYVDPYDVRSIASALSGLIEDTALRRRMSERGRERAKLFDQNAYVERLAKLYASL